MKQLRGSACVVLPRFVRACRLTRRSPTARLVFTRAWILRRLHDTISRHGQRARRFGVWFNHRWEVWLPPQPEHRSDMWLRAVSLIRPAGRPEQDGLLGEKSLKPVPINLGGLGA